MCETLLEPGPMADHGCGLRFDPIKIIQVQLRRLLHNRLCSLPQHFNDDSFMRSPQLTVIPGYVRIRLQHSNSKKLLWFGSSRLDSDQVPVRCH